MLEGNNSKPFGPLIKRGTGVDQSGRDQSTGPGLADGSTTSLWTDGKDTRTGKIKENALFKDIRVRTGNVADVQK